MNPDREMPLWAAQLAALIRKELLQVGADTRLIRMLVLAPIIQLLVFGTAVNFDVDAVPTAVVDQDQTQTSRGDLDELLADGTLKQEMAASDPATALAAMDHGDVAAVVILPHGYAADRLRHRPSPVQVVVDGTDARQSGVAASAAGRFFAQVGRDGAPPALRLEPRILANPTLDTQPYMVPGLAAMTLVSTTTLIAAMGLTREREVGTLEQVLVTPISAWVLLLGKVLPYVGLGLLSTALSLGAGTLWFDVPMRGSLVFLLCATLAYLLSTVGAGLMVATFARTQQQAFMGGFFFMIPAILLSGNMTPVIAMPEWMQPVTWANPLRWYIEILRANLLEGSSFADLWVHLVALLVIGGTLFVAAVRRFRMNLG
ncbi:MAG: ABC transporter permease [Myxococcota bacterium]